MADWFGKLMQRGHARGQGADVERKLDARDARYDAVIQMLRDREGQDREARERRQRGYKQSLACDAVTGSDDSSLASPIRLHRFRAKVPCRATPEARALLDQLRKRYSGCTVTFPQLTSRQHAVMLSGGAGTERKQIGWIEHCVQTDPKLCNVRHQGLAVETDGGMMLVLRFLYPPTGVRMSSKRDAHETLRHRSRDIDARVSPPQVRGGLELPDGAIDEVAWVDFAEIRPALDLRPSDKTSSPRQVWLTRPEVETMNALRSRDFEAFYVRFKLEVQAGIWSSLSALLSSAPGSQWHRGSCYTVVNEPDATNRRIYQRTVDDSDRAVDIGSDRIYDAAPATDILLLYLEGDILADFADIYFSLQTLSSTDAYSLKEEFFTVIRRFWASAQSLTSRYGSDLATVVRMSQRAVPMPAQAPLLKQDWTSLRQSLVDRYGKGGRKAAALVSEDVYRPRLGPVGWPFASFPAGEVNVGLRLIYRQEWRNLGAQRGDVIRRVPSAPKPAGRDFTAVVETIIEHADTTRTLDAVVREAVNATVQALKWPLDLDGSIHTGVRGLASRTDMGLESECRESSRDTSTRLSDVMLGMATNSGDGTARTASVERGERHESSSSGSTETITEQDAATHVYSRLQNRYEVLTRPNEIQNVVMVAEKLPAPAEIDLSWVRRHDWILATVLLDDSFRDALETIGQDAGQDGRAPDASASPADLPGARNRLYEHLRANILHYQRAIWQQEDPQQRSMRYRKSGKKVPLAWRFELVSGGALTIDELGERLGAPNVDGQFAAYSTGQEADLDQVIDPAGPIGYYGNFAIYHMRPEFGSDELFSMLHFFKSPYLRPNPETGEPEVDDPMQMQLSEDPAVVAATDHAIDEHREQMFRCVPELRLALARARERAGDGTDPSAVERLQRQSGALQRHFATYLFRRERARQIALDADGVVIDVIRGADSAPEKPGDRDATIDVGEPPDGYQVILESGRGIELLRATAHRDAEAEWEILRGGRERMPSLIAGAGASLAPERMILSLGDHERAVSLRAGPARQPDGEPLIRAREHVGRRVPSFAGGGAAPAGECVILARDDGERLWLRAGRGHDPETSVVRASADAGLRLTGAGDRPIHEPVIVSFGVAGPTPRLCAGRARDPDAERVILARDDAGLSLGAPNGGGAVYAHEQVILAGGDELVRPILVAGAGVGRARERVIVARNDGWLRPSLVAG